MKNNKNRLWYQLAACFSRMWWRWGKAIYLCTYFWVLISLVHTTYETVWTVGGCWLLIEIVDHSSSAAQINERKLINFKETWFMGYWPIGGGGGGDKDSPRIEFSWNFPYFSTNSCAPTIWWPSSSSAPHSGLIRQVLLSSAPDNPSRHFIMIFPSVLPWIKAVLSTAAAAD